MGFPGGQGALLDPANGMPSEKVPDFHVHGNEALELYSWNGGDDARAYR